MSAARTTNFAGPGRTRHLPLAADLQTTGEDPVDPSRAVSSSPRATVDHRLCRTCQGRGYHPDPDDGRECPACDGTGER